MNAPSSRTSRSESEVTFTSSSTEAAERADTVTHEASAFTRERARPSPVGGRVRVGRACIRKRCACGGAEYVRMLVWRAHRPAAARPRCAAAHAPTAFIRGRARVHQREYGTLYTVAKGLSSISGHEPRRHHQRKSRSDRQQRRRGTQMSVRTAEAPLAAAAAWAAPAATRAVLVAPASKDIVVRRPHTWERSVAIKSDHQRSETTRSDQRQPEAHRTPSKAL